MHAAAAAAGLSLIAMAELVDARHDGAVPVAGTASLARIHPAADDPTMWRWVSGVGPVLADRLARAVGRGEICQPADLRGVPGVGPIMAKRIGRCVCWDCP
jgi:hypothetical protein